MRLLLFNLALLLLPVFAAAEEKLSGCISADLRSAAPGFRCKTKAGFPFKLLHRSEKGKEFWLDETSALLWGDQLSERIRRKAAASLCARKTEGENFFPDRHLSELPTMLDFTTAEAHGFREVLPNFAEKFYWMKSEVPGAANIGHVFNGNFGKAEIVVYRSINFENIRCVARAVKAR